MYDLGLAIVFVLGIAWTAFMLMTSWGGTSWVFCSAVSVVVGGLALLRERQLLLTTIAGLAVTGIAVAVSLSAAEDLPQEPAPVTALALAVLVGSAIRTLPIGQVAAVAVGGVVIVGATWFEGSTAVTVLATTGMVAALVVGPVLRVLDRVRRPQALAGESVV
ncbi:metal transporter [Kribbella flavida]|uniref:metal transporter n=1 Tax=Kribbella flavida TaxID=182640 RepID=UPI0002E53D57|nr:metal transporter [Kribbella flavida]